MARTPFVANAVLCEEFGMVQSQLKKIANAAHVPSTSDGALYAPALRAFMQPQPTLSKEHGFGAVQQAFQNPAIFGNHPAHVVYDGFTGNQKFYGLWRQTSAANNKQQFVKLHSRRYLTRTQTTQQCDFELGDMLKDNRAHYYVFLCEEVHYLWCIDHPTLCREFTRVKKMTRKQSREAKESNAMFWVTHKRIEVSRKTVPHLMVRLTIGGDYSLNKPSEVGL